VEEIAAWQIVFRELTADFVVLSERSDDPKLSVMKENAAVRAQASVSLIVPGL
jgi:hypothetical protein